MENKELAKGEVSEARADSPTKMPKRVYFNPDPGSEKLSMQSIAGFPLTLLCSDIGKMRLSSTLRGTVKGRTESLRSTLYADKTLEEIAGETLKVATEGVTSDYLREFEEHWAQYTSPISIQAPAEYRKESLLDYEHVPEITATDEQLDLGVQLAWKFLGLDNLKGALRPLSIEAGAERLPKSTAWGQPWFVPGVQRDKSRDKLAVRWAREHDPQFDDTKWDYQYWINWIPTYVEQARYLAENLDDPLWDELNCSWYWRGDIGKPKDDPSHGTKQRDVWGYPHGVSILESCIYSVLTDALRGRPGFVGWTDVQNIVDTISEHLRKVGDSRGAQLMWAFDASKWDKRIGEKLIDRVSRGIVQPCFQEGSRRLIEKLSSYSKNCGIITPFGILCKNRGGNRPSGSGGTNILDSLEQLVMFIVVMLVLDFSEEEILECLAEVMGDDGSYVVPIEFGSKPVTDTYLNYFGAIINVTKEELSGSKTSFLKRIYDNDHNLKGVASIVRTVLKAAQYERQTPDGWNEAMENIRVISSLENCSYHPKFHAAIDYCVRGIRLGLGTRFEGGPLALFKHANDWAAANGTSIKKLLDREDWDRPYQGSDVSDPSSLKVVQYLLSKVE